MRSYICMQLCIHGQNEMEPQPQPIPFEMLTRREQKGIFRQVLEKFPDNDTERYQSNWCQRILRRQSVQRHVRDQHADRHGGHWNDHCRPVNQTLIPTLRDLSTVIDGNRITVIAHVTWRSPEVNFILLMMLLDRAKFVKG